MIKSRQHVIAVSAAGISIWLFVVMISVVDSGRPAVLVRRINPDIIRLHEDPRVAFGSTFSMFEDSHPLAKPEDRAHWSRLQDGVVDFRAGNSHKAKSAWLAIAAETPNSAVAVSAFYNIGNYCRDSGNCKEAVTAYRRALNVNVESSLKHYIALDLSQVHLELHQFDAAIRTAKLAKTEYPPDSFCGFYYLSEQNRISDYIASINVALSEKRPIRFGAGTE